MGYNYIDQLHGLLEKEGFSQGQLAERLGVTFAALNRWLNGHAKPRANHILAIRKLYRETVGYPSIDDRQLGEIIRQAKGLKKQGLWDRIAKNQDLQNAFLLEHTFNSTSIEGTTFSKKETEVVIFNQGMIADKTLVEHLEVTNHAAVLREIFQKRIQPPLTEDLIRKIHKGLLQGIREDAGFYSKHQRAIRGVEIALTHPEDIPEEMRGLIRTWQGKPQQKTIKEIAAFHASFELIHPFGDGNGRVGRLLMVLQCLKEGYPPVVIENARRAEYYEVLEYAQRKSGNPFVQFLFEEMEHTDKMLKKYL